MWPNCQHSDENFVDGGNPMPAYFSIDKTRTEQINQAIDDPLCECDNCQWFYYYMKHIPAAAKEFFLESGLDPEKCQELWAYFPHDNGHAHYSGFFYIAIKSSPISKPFTISSDWKVFGYGSFSFQVRLEYTIDDKQPILGFEAHLPEKPDSFHSLNGVKGTEV